MRKSQFQAQQAASLQQASNRADKMLWGCAILAVLLGLMAVGQSQQAASTAPAFSQEYDATSPVEFPTMGEPAPTGEGFQAINDGRVPPGEAIIGVNEIRPQQGNCPNGQCPLTYTNYAPNYAPPPPVVYPANYAPAYYSQPTYSDGGEYYYSDGEVWYRARFPIARAAIRGTARVAMAPFRLIRAIRSNRCCN